jgi:hypothetical protein
VATKRKKRQKSKPLRYFFYNGELHKKIQIHRGSDTIVAWSYPRGHTVKLVYSEVRQKGEKAFTTRQVADFVNRRPRVVKAALDKGMFTPPQRTYGIDENKNEYAYYWSEKDIMNLHEYLCTVHRGRPRKDGLITPAPLPSAAELRAVLRQGTVFYVRSEDGEFVQTWQAEKF